MHGQAVAVFCVGLLGRGIAAILGAGRFGRRGFR